MKIFSVVVMLTAILFGGLGESEAWALDNDEEQQKAQQFIEKVEQGDPEAQYIFGMMYDLGEGVPQDYAEALKWYRKSAEQGLAKAQAMLGEIYSDGKEVVSQDYVEAFKWSRKAAKQGVAPAQFKLGLMYSLGKGIPQDYAAAVKWFRKAAEQGNVEAQSILGTMNLHGKGIPQNYTEAFKWVHRAAEHGDNEAYFTLGFMYFDGKGVPQDYSEAYFWLNLAAASNVPDAAKFRDMAAEKLSNEDLRKVQQRASNWQPKK